jgi:hypothetical protein
MRLLLATTLATLAVATPASAKYLHINSEAGPASEEYWGKVVPIPSVTLHHCWHAGPHVVQCSYTKVLWNERDKTYSPEQNGVFVIALRRNGSLYGHTLGVDKPRWIRKLRSCVDAGDLCPGAHGGLSARWRQSGHRAPA